MRVVAILKRILFFIWLTVGVTARVLADPAAIAAAPAAGCAAQGVAVCTPPGGSTLRELELKNAVDNGDLSPAAAEKILKSHEHRRCRLKFASSGPADARAPGRKNRFWRDERRRLLPSDPSDPN